MGNWTSLLVGICLTCLSLNPSFGQLAIIQDDDGYVNVRKEASGKSEIMTQLYDGEVFGFYEVEGTNWSEISFTLDKIRGENGKYYEKFTNKKGEAITVGYMHKSRILPISKLPNIANNESLENRLILKHDVIEISFSFGDFKKENHQLSYFQGSKEFVKLIDKTVPLGVDGNLPTREIQSIQINWGDFQIDMPKNEFKDLFQPNIQGIQLKSHKGYIYMTMLGNSDGAGGYGCVWIFKDRKYMGRYIGAP